MNHEQIRVLLVEDNPGDALLLREMFNESARAAIELSHVQRLAEALQTLGEHRHDIVLLDLGLPDSAGIATFDLLHTAHPEVPIVVLSGLDDEQVAMTAVERGAQDYLNKNELSGPMLVRAIRYAITRHEAQSRVLTQVQSDRHGELLAFIGAKGGVGTTTLALNIAALLESRGHSTVLVELRSYPGTLSAMLDVQPVQDLSNLWGLSPGELSPELLRTALFVLPSGLRVLFGPQRITEPVLPDAEQVGALMRALKQLAAYVVLDLPSMPSELSRAALQEAWRVVLVSEAEPTSVRSGRDKVELLRSWGITGQLVGALAVNRVALPLGFNIEEVRAGLGCPLLGVVPPAPEDCAVAVQAGAPVVLLRPEATISIRLGELLELMTAEAVTPLVP